MTLPEGAVRSGGAAIDAAAAALRAGAVLAVKGLGGYHLAVRAADEDAVRTLRGRKHREDRSFAVAVPDLVAARALCHVDDDEAALLSHKIARDVERELEYPGQIKVTVIRESRATDYAR